MAKMLGIDIGGTGIKGAIVDTNEGLLLSDRIKYATPKNATPKNVIETALKIVKDLDWEGKPIGAGCPAIVKQGITKSATNIDKSWIDFPVEKTFSNMAGAPVTLLNDADAAGLAELSFGEAKDVPGVCILITLGTGIGSATFIDGILVPNTELGMLKMGKGIAEDYASNRVRDKYDMKWEDWGANLNDYLNHLELLFSPTKIVISGGVSKKFSKYEKYLNTEAQVVPAKLRNNAGIIGAALGMQGKISHFPIFTFK